MTIKYEIINNMRSMNSRKLQNIQHVVGTLAMSLLFFSGYFIDKSVGIAILLFLGNIIITRISSETAYQINRELMRENMRL